MSAACRCISFAANCAPSNSGTTALVDRSEHTSTPPRPTLDLLLLLLLLRRDSSQFYSFPPVSNPNERTKSERKRQKPTRCASQLCGAERERERERKRVRVQREVNSTTNVFTPFYPRTPEISYVLAISHLYIYRLPSNE